MTKEQLVALGLNDEQIAEVFKLNGLAIEDVKKTNATLTQENEVLKTQLSGANEQIEKFADIDVEKIKKEIEVYKEKLKDSEVENAKKLTELELDFEIDKAILASGAKNAKAIKALLDIDGLRESKNFKEDTKVQIEGLKSSDPYMFGDNEKIRVISASGGAIPEMTKDEFDKLGFAERVALKRKNEELYNKLKGE